MEKIQSHAKNAPTIDCKIHHFTKKLQIGLVFNQADLSAALDTYSIHSHISRSQHNLNNSVFVFPRKLRSRQKTQTRKTERGPKSTAVAAKRPKFLSWAVFPSGEAVDQVVLAKNPQEALKFLVLTAYSRGLFEVIR